MKSNFEWEEEIPQPKPPTRRCELVVFSGDDRLNSANYRAATLADIARALGVTEASLSGFLKREIEERARAQVAQSINSQVGYMNSQVGYAKKGYPR